MKNSPFVSIIIPVYNGSNYIEEAIDSALAQTYPNIEIIVVNDGSNDGKETEHKVLSYGDKVRYFSKENGGVSSALNLGIEKMRGNYFSWLSHDDIYIKNKIQKQVELITSENDIILCSGTLINENGSEIPNHVRTLKRVLNGRELFCEFLKGYTLNGLGFLIPRKVFEQAGTFDESMRYLQDLDLWLRMLQLDFRFVCHNDLLVVSRIHKKQTTNTASELFDVDRKKLAEKHMAMLECKDTNAKTTSLKLYYLLFVKGQNNTGEKLAKNALKEIGQFDFNVQVKAMSYRVKGLVKKKYRKVYYLFLKIKDERG